MRLKCLTMGLHGVEQKCLAEHRLPKFTIQSPGSGSDVRDGGKPGNKSRLPIRCPRRNRGLRNILIRSIHFGDLGYHFGVFLLFSYGLGYPL